MCMFNMFLCNFSLCIYGVVVLVVFMVLAIQIVLHDLLFNLVCVTCLFMRTFNDC